MGLIRHSSDGGMSDYDEPWREKQEGRRGRRRRRERKRKDSPHELRWHTNNRRHDVFPKNW
jgi:hypothetical protein